MNQDQLNNHKEKLERERMALLEEIKRAEKPADFGDDVDEFEEATDRTEDYANQLAVASDLKKRLDEIDIALSKIKNGTYGNCQKCGGPIGEEVLSLSPEAPFCKKCKA